VVHGDAAPGVADDAPYDRILVTAGAWDIPASWTEQLAPGGRIVVPLRMRGLTRTLALDAVTNGGGHLIARSARVFGFVPVTGAGAQTETAIKVCGGELTLTFDDDHAVDPDAIADAFTGERVETWTGVPIRRDELLDTLQMWLATVAPGFCTVRVDPGLDTGLVALPPRRSSALACVVGDSVAHLTTRSTEDEQTLEYGVHAFGPQALGLAELLTRHLRTWSAEHRGGPGPCIRVYPAGTADRDLAPGHVIVKRHRRVVLSWPDGPAPTPVRPW
jgi:protein-L-isoaspartate(D-aspartate) O-methyltransferase